MHIQGRLQGGGVNHNTAQNIRCRDFKRRETTIYLFWLER